jgi:hypothetical protein
MNKKITIGVSLFILGLGIGFSADKIHSLIQANAVPSVANEHVSLEKFLGDVESSELTSQELEDVNRVSAQNSGAADRFNSFKSISDILTLSSEFDQTEALYVIAGRANNDTIKKLIIQANNIADISDRQGALAILFIKLADTDPKIAIEMSQLPVFADNENLGASVWRAWARSDLGAALSVAQNISSNSEKDKIAQILYMAVGITGNDASRKIESVLNIRPGQRAQWQYVLGLAKNSPNEAVSYTANIRKTSIRNYLAKRLGEYLGQNISEQAINLAEVFRSMRSKNMYLQAANNAIAIANPEQAIRNWLAQSTPGELKHQGSKELSFAFQELADTDIDSALSIWADIENEDQKLALSSTLVLAMAKQDISTAISWAFDIDQQLGTSVKVHQKVLNRTVRQLARVDSIQTLNAILALPQNESTQTLLSSIVKEVAEVDPNSAIQVISTLSDKPRRVRANEQLLSGWMNQDPIAALDYISNNIGDLENQTLARVSYKLQALAPEIAMGYISKIPSDIADQWLASIATSAAENKTQAEFEAFINQYQHLDPNEVMKASLVKRLSQSNIAAAEMLASAMRPSEQKNIAINTIIQKKVRSDPQGAVDLWNTIESESAKKESLPRLVYGWDKEDRDGLRNWVSQLPDGDQKDSAIYASIYSGGLITEADITLINNVSEESSRQQTISQALSRMAFTDPATARRLAQETKLNQVLQRRLIEYLDHCFGPNINDSNRPTRCRSHYDDH